MKHTARRTLSEVGRRREWSIAARLADWRSRGSELERKTLQPNLRSRGQHRIQLLLRRVLRRASFLLSLLPVPHELANLAQVLPIEGFYKSLLDPLFHGNGDQHIEPRERLEQRPLSPDGQSQQKRYGTFSKRAQTRRNYAVGR